MLRDLPSVEGTNVITGHKCNKGHKCKKIRVYLTQVKGLAQPLICNRFKKMVDAHSLNTGNRNKLDMPSFKFTSGQRP